MDEPAPNARAGRVGPASRAVVTTLVAVACAIGSVFATVDAVGGTVTALVELFEWIHVDRPPTPAVVRARLLWNVLLDQPWLLAIGLAVLASVRHHALAAGRRPRSIRRLSGGLAALVVLMSAVTIVTVSLRIIISTD